MSIGREYIDCLKANDISGRMGAGGLAGGIIGAYAGAGVASLPATVAFAATGMAIGALPTLGLCGYEVLSSSPSPAPAGNKAKTLQAR